MWILISAVVTASLLGSMHCVGMCGPLAIWASGAGDGRFGRQMAVATMLYHVGRLLTYALAGLAAGAAGQVLDASGRALGIQLVAARVVGVSMVAIGTVQLGKLIWQGWRIKRGGNLVATRPNLITRILLKLRPVVFQLPVAARGLVTGLLTALLPCGWLYLFALVAAGTGSIVMGPLVMVAFWFGTVPALVGLVTSTQALAVTSRRLVPTGAAIVLIIGGCYTAAGRGFARFNSLSEIQLGEAADFSGRINAFAQDTPSTDASDIVQAIEHLVKTPLPCCVENTGTASGAPTSGVKLP